MSDVTQLLEAAAAWKMLRQGITERYTEAEFAEHDKHVIKTARGKWIGPASKTVPGNPGLLMPRNYTLTAKFNF